jgi:hypothetical protein
LGKDLVFFDILTQPEYVVVGTDVKSVRISDLVFSSEDISVQGVVRTVPLLSTPTHCSYAILSFPHWAAPAKLV